MRGLTETRAYWGPFVVGVVAYLVLWGLGQANMATGGWIDLVLVPLALAAFGAVSAVVGRPAHGSWGGALAGLAGLLVADVVINFRAGYVAPAWTSDFATFLVVTGLALGVPYLAGYLLYWVVQRSRSRRGVTASRA